MCSTLKLVSIVMPALNEESGIVNTIARMPTDRMLELGYNLEILVIDGKSTDATVDVALQRGAKVIIGEEKGYGSAYKTGFKVAKGNIIVTLDSDGSYPAELIPDYIQHLEQGNLDFITVNRFSHIEKGAIGFSHRIGDKILSGAMNLLYSLHVKDSQSGMWIMKRSFVEGINLNADGMCMSEEIKIIAFKFFKSLELDGRYSKRRGTAKLRPIKDGWNNLTYLFKYKSLMKYAVLQEPVPQVAYDLLTEDNT